MGPCDPAGIGDHCAVLTPLQPAAPAILSLWLWESLMGPWSSFLARGGCWSFLAVWEGPHCSSLWFTGMVPSLHSLFSGQKSQPSSAKCAVLCGTPGIALHGGLGALHPSPGDEGVPRTSSVLPCSWKRPSAEQGRPRALAKSSWGQLHPLSLPRATHHPTDYQPDPRQV